ncbi:MAG: DUF1800 family protein [Cyanobium sp. PLM2.Bin73]|nr:MAG: DUF1800 family protein [Cyanobium sp. PLM2.Bin73]
MGSTAAPCSTLPREERGPCKRNQADTLQRDWLSQLAWGADQQRIWQVQLWLGVFPVNWRQLADPLLLEGQIAAISRHLNGSFSELLGAMVLDPALQISLNGPANHRRNPNENLARELLELFSLGEGHFSEADVREAARALSGYRLERPQPDGAPQLVLDPRRHDFGPKTILGRSHTFDAESLAAWLAEQPTTARHISARIWRQQVGTAASPQRLEALANGWRQRQLSIPWLMEAIAAAPEAIESRQRGLRLADPLEMVARSLRLLGSRHADVLAISLRGLREMGQSPFEPPSVKGWPVNEQWLNLRWLQARRRTLAALLADEEVWASRLLPPELPAWLTPIAPLGLELPAEPSREALALLFADPVWQLA